jgi:uridine kinase
MTPQFIAIVGGSGSGKTWLADQLAKQLGRRVSRLSQDDFYADRSRLTVAQRKRVNFDHPRAIEWDLFFQALRELNQGRSVSVPHYDFTQSTRSTRFQLCQPRAIILVDGLWLLRKPEIRRCFIHSYFVECPSQLRLERRLRRDQRERARSETSVRTQFRERTEPMHQRYVEPQRRHASEILNSPVSIEEARRLARQLESRLNPEFSRHE